MAKITWKIENEDDITLDVREGLTLMEAATDNDIPHIWGECGGCLSCATCHVFVDEKWFSMLNQIDESEDTMLDMTDVERMRTSRLSCQITVTPELDGLVLHVPVPD